MLIMPIVYVQPFSNGFGKGYRVLLKGKFCAVNDQNGEFEGV